jgi:predicted RND superfamily exporter protein
MEELKSKKSRFHWFLTKHRAWVLLSFIAVTVVMGTGVFRIKSNIILSDLVPYDHPYVHLYARFTQVFGGGGTSVLIGLKDRQKDIFNKRIKG